MRTLARRPGIGAGLALAIVASCGGDGASDATAPASSDRCIVRLHGKGGTGAETVVDDGVAELSPGGNAEGWGGRQWLYFPDSEYESARAVIADAIDAAGCSRVVIDGFSNGGAFAAKLWCRAETFGGRLVGVVIDDPVPDHAATSCEPAADVHAVLYWTGALAKEAPSGADCGVIDWTCEGGTVIGIDAYSAALGLTPQPSPFPQHEWYREAPELAAWLA